MTTQPLPVSRVDDITRQIRGAALPFLDANTSAVTARDMAQAENVKLTGTREQIMVRLADLSMHGQWLASEVKAASTKAAELSKSETEKALSVFIGQTRRAMDPKVRSHVASLVKVRDMGWEAETLAIAEDKDAPRPLRKAFARGYHLLMELFGLAEKGRVIEDVRELLAFAAERDPDLDIEKVKARLKSIQAQLASFYNDWPVDDIQLCVETIGEITEKALRNSRANIPNTVSTVVEITQRPLPPVPATVVAANMAADNAAVIPEAEKSPEQSFLDDMLAA